MSESTGATDLSVVWLSEGQNPHHPLKVAARVRIPLGLPIASS